MSTTVYVLLGRDDYNGDTLLGVYSTKPLAERAMPHVCTRHDELVVRAVQVDGPPTLQDDY